MIGIRERVRVGTGESSLTDIFEARHAPMQGIDSSRLNAQLGTANWESGNWGAVGKMKEEDGNTKSFSALTDGGSKFK